MKLTLILLLAAFFFSCKKHTNENNSLTTCGPFENLDSVAIIPKLVGSWKLIKIRAGSNGQIYLPGKSVTVTFAPNSTYQLFEDSVLTLQGKTELKYNGIGWGLNITGFRNYLGGSISFCDNLVVFNDNPLDGNANLYEKGN